MRSGPRLWRILLAACAATASLSYEDAEPGRAWGLAERAHDLEHYVPDCRPRSPERPSEFDLVCSQRDAVEGAVRVACVGDSITAVGHTSSKAHQYPSQLQSMLDAEAGAGAYSVTNLGRCGATLRKSGALPYWTTAQFSALKGATWDVVIVMLGTNDARVVGSGGPEHWPASCDDATADTLGDCEFARDYAALLDLISGLGPGGAPPEVFVMVPPPLMRQGDYGMNQTIINSVLPKLVPLIAEANKATVRGTIDVYKGMGGEIDWRGKLPPECTLGSAWPPCRWYCDEQSCDQCHPNDQGCARLAEVVKRGWLGETARLI